MKVLIAAMALLVAACGGVVTSSSGAPAVAASHTPKPSFITFPPNFSPDVPTPEASVETPAETGQYKAGDTVTVSVDNAPWAEITVSKVSVKKKYDGAYDLDDVPKRGNVYIQAYVTYKALANGVDYNPYDWQVFAGDTAVGDTSYVSNGPTPTLDSGTLPKGRKAGGWVVYEVPAKGAVRMSYVSSARASCPRQADHWMAAAAQHFGPPTSAAWFEDAHVWILARSRRP